MSQPVATTAVRKLRRWRSVLKLDNRYLAPVAHHRHPHRRSPVVRHPRELREDGSRDRHQLSLSKSRSGRIVYGTWPHLASAYITGISVGILLRSLAILAVRFVQRNFYHIEICLARQRPPSLESVQFRHLRNAIPRRGYRGQPKHSVGK